MDNSRNNKSLSINAQEFIPINDNKNLINDDKTTFNITQSPYGHLNHKTGDINIHNQQINFNNYAYKRYPTGVPYQHNK
jgi:hypothetical protein